MYADAILFLCFFLFIYLGIIKNTCAWINEMLISIVGIVIEGMMAPNEKSNAD